MPNISTDNNDCNLPVFSSGARISSIFPLETMISSFFWPEKLPATQCEILVARWRVRLYRYIGRWEVSWGRSDDDAGQWSPWSSTRAAQVQEVSAHYGPFPFWPKISNNKQEAKGIRAEIPCWVRSAGNNLMHDNLWYIGMTFLLPLQSHCLHPCGDRGFLMSLLLHLFVSRKWSLSRVAVSEYSYASTS